MTDILALRRRMKRALAASLFVLSLAGSAAATEDSQAWFRYDPKVEKAWEISAPHPLTRRIHRRAADPSAPLQHVLVLYPRPSSAYDIAISKILSVFEAKEINVEVTVVNFQLDDERGMLALQRAEDRKVDLIYAMGSESTSWLYDHYRAGHIPVVTVCSKDPVQLGQMHDYESGSGTNFAFTSLNVPVSVQMTYVSQLRPTLKNIAILVDRKNSSAVQTQAQPIADYAKEHGINVIWGAVEKAEDARAELVQIVGDAVKTMRKSDPDLTNSLFWVTGSTSVFTEIHTINANADRVPVVSVVPEIVHEGPDTAVLGIGVSFESNAHVAAIYGANILEGKAKAGDLKVGLVSPPDIAISFLKARQIGMRIPFGFFEVAGFVYDYDGRPVRTVGADH